MRKRIEMIWFGVHSLLLSVIKFFHEHFTTILLRTFAAFINRIKKRFSLYHDKMILWWKRNEYCTKWERKVMENLKTKHVYCDAGFTCFNVIIKNQNQDSVSNKFQNRGQWMFGLYLDKKFTVWSLLSTLATYASYIVCLVSFILSCVYKKTNLSSNVILSTKPNSDS